MTTNRLWFGPIAALLLFAGIVAVGLITPGYSHVRQTVSELGEVGSPGRIAFSVLLCLVAVCLILFASAVARTLREAGLSALPAYVVGAMAISTAGVGIFSFPLALHNIFGMSETVGYQAPLFAALVCKMDARANRIKWFSIIMYAVVLLAIAINTIALVRPADIWSQIKPFFGLVQRSLFAAWFIWCTGYAVLLMRLRRADQL
jgi:hypothetical membrane protein